MQRLPGSVACTFVVVACANRQRPHAGIGSRTCVGMLGLARHWQVASRNQLASRVSSRGAILAIGHAAVASGACTQGGLGDGLLVCTCLLTSRPFSQGAPCALHSTIHVYRCVCVLVVSWPLHHVMHVFVDRCMRARRCSSHSGPGAMQYAASDAVMICLIVGRCGCAYVVGCFLADVVVIDNYWLTLTFRGGLPIGHSSMYWSFGLAVLGCWF